MKYHGATAVEPDTHIPRTIIAALVFALLGTCAHTVSAQVRASVSGLGGIASVTSSRMAGTSVNGAAGAKVTFDLSPRLGVEGSALWIDNGRSGSSLPIEGRLVFSFLPAERRARPFAAAGAGLYRASYDMGQRALQVGTTDPAWLQRMMGGMWTSTDMSRFMSSFPQMYAGRVTEMLNTRDMPLFAGSHAAFWDPAISVGTGMVLAPVSHVVLSPEIRLHVVLGGGHTRTTGEFLLGAGYRF